MTPHPEMEPALALLEATLAGSPEDAGRLGALLARLLPGERNVLLIAGVMLRCDPMLVNVLLEALARAGVVPEGSDGRNIPAALARHAEEQA